MDFSPDDLQVSWSDFLLQSTFTTTSLVPGDFSCEDSNSSADMKVFKTVSKIVF